MSTYLTEPPEIVPRPARPYVAVRRTVTMKTMDQIADQVPRVIRWIVERDVDPAGAPFLRYRRIDMEGEPAEQPDLRLWRTELAFRLRD